LLSAAAKINEEADKIKTKAEKQPQSQRQYSMLDDDTRRDYAILKLTSIREKILVHLDADTTDNRPGQTWQPGTGTNSGKLIVDFPTVNMQISKDAKFYYIMDGKTTVLMPIESTYNTRAEFLTAEFNIPLTRTPNGVRTLTPGIRAIYATSNLFMIDPRDIGLIRVGDDLTLEVRGSPTVLQQVTVETVGRIYMYSEFIETEIDWQTPPRLDDFQNYRCKTTKNPYKFNLRHHFWPHSELPEKRLLSERILAMGKFRTVYNVDRNLPMTICIDSEFNMLIQALLQRNVLSKRHLNIIVAVRNSIHLLHEAAMLSTRDNNAMGSTKFEGFSENHVKEAFLKTMIVLSSDTFVDDNYKDPIPSKSKYVLATWQTMVALGWAAEGAKGVFDQFADAVHHVELVRKEDAGLAVDRTFVHLTSDPFLLLILDYALFTVYFWTYKI